MIFKTRLTQKDYINVSFTILFSYKGIRVFMYSLGGVVLFSCISNLMTGDGNYTPIIPPVLIGIIIFGAMYFSAKNNYKKNNRLQEIIEYNFLEDYLEITGESFNGKFTWDKVPKVTLSKKWLFIWHNNQTANAISRDYITTAEIEEIRSIIERHGVKNNLP